MEKLKLKKYFLNIKLKIYSEKFKLKDYFNQIKKIF